MQQTMTIPCDDNRLLTNAMLDAICFEKSEFVYAHKMRANFTRWSLGMSNLEVRYYHDNDNYIVHCNFMHMLDQDTKVSTIREFWQAVFDIPKLYGERVIRSDIKRALGLC